MRKLKSREYCHNCGKTSEWTFEDRPGNQIIICPVCGHKHYRVVTGELVRPEIRYKGKIIKDVKKFLRWRPWLRKKFQKLEEEAEMRFEVSNLRWGQDPTQMGGFSWTWYSAHAYTTASTSYSSTTGYWYDSSVYDTSANY